MSRRHPRRARPILATFLPASRRQTADSVAATLAAHLLHESAKGVGAGADHVTVALPNIRNPDNRGALAEALDALALRLVQRTPDAGIQAARELLDTRY